MSGTALKSRDLRILGALADGPLSSREVEDKLRREVWHAWADRHDLEIEWDTPSEPVGARIMAMAEATDLGVPYVRVGSAYARLVSLERRGFVTRIQIPGHRPMLWRAAA